MWYSAKHWVDAQGVPIKDKLTQPDLFMMIFYPAAIGNPNYQFPDSVVEANAGIKTPTDYYNRATAAAPFQGVYDMLEGAAKVVDIVKKNP